MKKIITSISLLLILLVNNHVLAYDIHFSDDRKILLYEEQSQSILFGDNLEERIYPASTTKIVTALVVLDHLKLDDRITVGEEITYISSDSSKAKLKIGENLTTQELLYGLLLASGNDVANVLAKNVGGKIGEKSDSLGAIKVFVEEMNKKAESLGAKGSQFRNPHGLHEEEHYTTLKDMLIFTRELLKNDIAKRIISTKSYTLETNLSTHNWINTNVYLHETWDEFPYVKVKGDNEYYIEDVKGVKTGFTDKAGRCIVFLAHKDNMELIGMVFNSTYEEIWQEGIDLLNYGVDNFDYRKIVSTDEKIESVHISNAKRGYSPDISVIAKEDIYKLLSSNDILSHTIEFDKDIIVKDKKGTLKLKKNIEANEIIGEITYRVNDTVVETLSVYTMHGLEKKSLLETLFTWPFIIITFALVFLLIGGMIIKKQKKSRKVKR